MLTEIVAHKRQELAGIDRKVRIDAIQRLLDGLPPVRSLKAALAADADLSVIAEIKRRSPSRGQLAENVNVAERARVYEAAGARAISVLTDQKYFAGTIVDLQAARQAVDLPVLRKDFIIDEYQVYESRAVGADVILLIVAALEQAELEQLHRLAVDLGLEVLVEVHSEEELRRAADINAALIGINNRDLRTFEVSLDTTERLCPLVSNGAYLVAESGIRTPDDVQRVVAAGANAVLVGESLMTAPDPGVRIRELLGAKQ